MAPYAIFTKFGVEEQLTGPHPHAKLTIVTFKMWAYGPQNRRNW